MRLLLGVLKGNYLLNLKGLKARLLAPLVAIVAGLSMIGPAALPAAATCTAPCAYDTYVTGTANSGLVAYYPMYETSGTTMNDTSGNGLNGTYASSNITYFGVGGAKFLGAATGSEATTPSLDLRPANTGSEIVTVNFWMKDQETRTGERMLFTQSGDYTTRTGAIGFELRDGSPSQGTRLAATQAVVGVTTGGAASNINVDDFDHAGDTGWHMYTVLYRRDFDYGSGGTNDCFSGELIFDGALATSYSNDCTDIAHVDFPLSYFEFGAYGIHLTPAAFTMRGFGVWTRPLSSTEISDLFASTFH